MAPGLDVAIEASNGASDYGNKFGEPVLTGFARSFGMMVSEEERREWVKPIMFSGGIGSLEASHVNKETPGTGEFPTAAIQSKNTVCAFLKLNRYFH